MNIDNLIKEELETLAALVLFGACLTIKEANNTKTISKLKLASALENIEEESGLNDTDKIVDLATKFSNFLKEKINA